MKIVDIADEIFRELDQPTDGSIPQIAFWIRVNMGSLNNLLHTEYAIDTTTLEISPDPGIQEKSILKRLYNIHYYNLKLRGTLGAVSLDTIIEVGSDGSYVKKSNKNETSKIYVSIKRQEQDELNREIASYKLGKSVPIQVAGDDTVSSNNFPSTDDIRTQK